MGETPSAPPISTQLPRLAQQAHQSPAMACTTLELLADDQQGLRSGALLNLGVAHFQRGEPAAAMCSPAQ